MVDKVPYQDNADLLQQLAEERRARIEAEQSLANERDKNRRLTAILRKANLLTSRRIAAALAPEVLGKVTRPDGFCDMTAATFADETGLSEEIARQCLEELSLAGKLEARDVPYTYTDNLGRARTGTYVYHRVPRGEEFEEEWGHPETWGPLPRCQTRENEAASKTDRRKKVKALETEVTELRKMRWVCPHCEEDSTEVSCVHCGQATELVEVVKQFEATAPSTSDQGKGQAKRGGVEDSNQTLGSIPPHCTTTQSLIATPAGAADDQQALDTAIKAITPALTIFRDNHIEMRNTGRAKYTSENGPLSPASIRDHLVGKRVLGAGLFEVGPDGQRRSGCIAFDDDGSRARLMSAYSKLAAHGLRPILDGNPGDSRRAHLWLFFTTLVDPAVAIAAVEAIAPELRAVKERFPNPGVSNGQRIRLPGGCYIDKDFDKAAPVPVLSGPVGDVPQWVGGNTPDAWRIIANCVSDPSLLPDVDLQPTPKPQRTRYPRTSTSSDFYERFRAEHSIEDLLEEFGVEVRGDGKFLATWRGERTASVHLYPGDEENHEHACDYGDEHRHLDSFDVFCCLMGYYNDGNIDKAAGRLAALKRWPHLGRKGAAA